jgi:6-phosphogluconate dehydrogenase
MYSIYNLVAVGLIVVVILQLAAIRSTEKHLNFVALKITELHRAVCIMHSETLERMPNDPNQNVDVLMNIHDTLETLKNQSDSLHQEVLSGVSKASSTVTEAVYDLKASYEIAQAEIAQREFDTQTTTLGAHD